MAFVLNPPVVVRSSKNISPARDLGNKRRGKRIRCISKSEMSELLRLWEKAADQVRQSSFSTSHALRNAMSKQSFFAMCATHLAPSSMRAKGPKTKQSDHQKASLDNPNNPAEYRAACCPSLHLKSPCLQSNFKKTHAGLYRP